MKYTITEQLSVSPLNDKLKQCDNHEATQQMEIYKARETQNRICVIRPFNNNKFTHELNAVIHMVPAGIINGVILPAYKDTKKIQR